MLKISNASDSKVDLFRRTACAVCGSPELNVRMETRFPVLPTCTDRPPNEDAYTPYEVAICGRCGLIQLLTLVAPEFLYSEFHSEGTGSTWQEHYIRFSELILASKVGELFEIGAGQGQLVRHLQGKLDITVLEPIYRGPEEGIRVEKGMLTREFCAGLNPMASG